MAKDTHRDGRQQTMGERPSGKSRKLNLNATGCTAGDGQTGREIESRIKRERERDRRRGVQALQRTVRDNAS